MIKIAAFDVDHTLYTNNGISESAIEAITKLQQNGILFVLATGRGKYALQMIENSGLIPDYYVCASGAYVANKNRELITKHTFTKEEVENLTKDAIDNDFELLFKFETLSYVYNKYEQAMEHLHFMQNAYDFTKNGESRDYHITELPLGAVLHGDAKLVEKCSLKYPSLQFLPFAENRYDIVYKGIGKDWGLQQLCNLLDMNASNIIAFGDNHNDMTMIKYAGIGVVMGNGEQVLKDIADYVCEEADNNGIANTLMKYKLI